MGVGLENRIRGFEAVYHWPKRVTARNDGYERVVSRTTQRRRLWTQRGLNVEGKTGDRGPQLVSPRIIMGLSVEAGITEPRPPQRVRGRRPTQHEPTGNVRPEPRRLDRADN